MEITPRRAGLRWLGDLSLVAWSPHFSLRWEVVSPVLPDVSGSAYVSADLLDI